MTLKERLDAYEKLMRLDKPIGTLLLLWPTLWGLWFARHGLPRLDILLIFFAGTVLMRSAGCVVNDFADRNFDPHVERTRDRPLAAGLIGPREALALAAALMLAAFALVLQLNRLTVMLSFAAVALAVVYPFLKRFFSFPQAWLGIAFGFGIPMAFAALQGRVRRGGVGIADRQYILGHRLRYRICDGGPRRRHAHRGQIFRHSAGAK